MIFNNIFKYDRKILMNSTNRNLFPIGLIQRIICRLLLTRSKKNEYIASVVSGIPNLLALSDNVSLI